MNKIIISIFVLLLMSISTKAQTARAAWLEQDRFGMFIHWGLYSAAEGLWKGEKLRYLNNYAEWIRYRNRIPKDEYGQLASRLQWEHIDVEQWVIAAKKAGMKYIIMTAKHHDGVALWDSQVGKYTLPQLSGVNRDIIAELAQACRKHQLKLGFYYSHWIDWEHPYAWDHNQELNGHVSDSQFDQYWQEKAIPQLRELLTNYGDIAMMWFDMWIPYEQTIFKKHQLEQAVALIRELQPHCLINSRLGLPTDNRYVDFQTLGDNVFSNTFIAHPWETPGTIAHSWGYSGQEKEWKSTSQLLASLAANVSLNGSFTLNIGPRADGTIPQESISRLQDIGTWLSNYEQAIYSNTGLQGLPQDQDWGKVTRHQTDKIVYLHVFNWPLDQLLRFSGISSKPRMVELLSAKGAVSLPIQQQGPHLHITLPRHAPDAISSIIRIQYDQIDIDPHNVSESSFGGFALHGKNAVNTETLQLQNYDGLRPTHFYSSPTATLWNVYLPQAGTYSIDISAHNPTTKTVPLSLQLHKHTLQVELPPDGKVVAEPNEQNYTEEFKEHTLGKYTVDRPQYIQVKLKSHGPQQLWINRIWIAPVVVSKH